ncbi:MAG: TVP38/TMEM64 family protein [Hyphomicrobiaceae bacterium]
MTASKPRSATFRRWLPLTLLVAVMAVVFAMGWHRYISLKSIGLNYEALRSFIDAHLLLALLVFALAYVAVVALSFPGAFIMTLAGGLLFGWQLGSVAAVIGATIGATILFVVVNTSLGSSLSDRAGPFIARLGDGFRKNALSYMLFLRLVPVFPFCVVNLVPAIVGVPLSTFVIGTAVGIIPGSIAYSLAGAGLGSVVAAQNAAYKACLAGNPADPGTACPYDIDVGALVTPELVYAGIALGIVALIPVVIRTWSNRHAAA